MQKFFEGAQKCSFVSTKGSIILGGPEACLPKNFAKNYTQIYEILMLSETIFKVIFV